MRESSVEGAGWCVGGREGGWPLGDGLEGKEGERRGWLKRLGTRGSPGKDSYAMQVGMNEVQPLLSYIRDSGLSIPSRENTIPGKQLVLEQCIKEQWRGLVSCGPHAPSLPNQRCLEDSVLPLFSRLDTDGDGVFSRAELSEYMRKRSSCGLKPNDQLLTWLISAADVDQDGFISLQELRFSGTSPVHPPSDYPPPSGAPHVPLLPLFPVSRRHAFVLPASLPTPVPLPLAWLRERLKNPEGP